MTVRISAFLRFRIVGVVSGFSVFCMINRPRNVMSHSIRSLEQRKCIRSPMWVLTLLDIDLDSRSGPLTLVLWTAYEQKVRVFWRWGCLSSVRKRCYNIRCHTTHTHTHREHGMEFRAISHPCWSTFLAHSMLCTILTSSACENVSFACKCTFRHAEMCERSQGQDAGTYSLDPVIYSVIT